MYGRWLTLYDAAGPRISRLGATRAIGRLLSGTTRVTTAQAV
jgi:hypothetical protein